jgi:hypothetical protein
MTGGIVMNRIDARRAPRALALLGAIVVVSSACGTTSSASATPSTPIAASSLPAATPSEVMSTATPAASASVTAGERNPAAYVEGEPYAQKIDPANFVAVVDNPFMPLVPGTTVTFDGAERIEITISSDKKSILGVATTVVRDQVFVDGALAEDTLDWYAQDRNGNVWYFGEKTAEYDGGKVVSTKGTWEGGVDGAQPGIIMLADPQVGDVYRQEFYKGEAEDLAQVTGVGGSITVPYGTFSDILVTEEWTPLEPDVRERKTYVRGIGVVETRQIKGGSDVVQLTDVKPGS